MLRRAIAALLSITLALLALPCIAAATHTGAHDCCAPSAVTTNHDCCNSAAPHPATTPTPGRQTVAAIIAGAAPSTHLNERQLPLETSAFTAPPARVPATILRT